jgi:hypothetical protein
MKSLSLKDAMKSVRDDINERLRENCKINKTFWDFCFPYNAENPLRQGPNKKYRVQQFLDCCAFIPCRGNLFTEPLPSNVRVVTDTEKEGNSISLNLFFKIRKLG